MKKGGEKLNYRVNEQIKAPRVQVIGPDGKNLGVMPTVKALELADEYGLDLVEVAPNASPPVVRIMDYGKFLYQQKKKSKQKNKTSELKEIEMTPNIGEHDLNVKLRKMREFLEEGHKVKVDIRMRGRQVLYTELAENLAKRIISLLEDISTIEREPFVENRHVFFILRPRKKKK